MLSENEEYLTGFFELNLSRQQGLSGIAPIQTSEILAYCQLFEIEDAQLFFYKIRAADSAFIEFNQKKESSSSS